MIRTALFMAAVCTLLAACATAPPPPPSPPDQQTAVPSQAVVSLLDAARASRTAGDLDAAAASIERALRIERRSPALYLELARVRFAQHQFRQAEALSLKAASLALSEQALKAEAWSLIAQARQAAGDSDGALEAQNKASELRSQ